MSVDMNHRRDTVYEADPGSTAGGSYKEERRKAQRREEIVELTAAALTGFLAYHGEPSAPDVVTCTMAVQFAIKCQRQIDSREAELDGGF